MGGYGLLSFTRRSFSWILPRGILPSEGRELGSFLVVFACQGFWRRGKVGERGREKKMGILTIR